MTPKEELTEEICNEVGFCGCGNPDSALNLLHKVLLSLKKRDDYSDTRDESYNKSYEEIDLLLGYNENATLDDVDTNGMYWTYLYFLDNMELTEHGGGVRGCWLTDNGYKVLEMLDKLEKML